VLLALMFVGGSAGSSAGGPKVVRHVLMAKYTLRELRRTLHPRAVLPVKLGGRIVPDDTMRAVVVFMLFYILTFAIGAGIVIMLGADLVSGISGTAALIGNVGPGFGGSRTDGQLRRSPSGRPDRADVGDVDWTPGDSDRARAVAP
jgi:trk system potassium uptake protein TrkH